MNSRPISFKLFGHTYTIEYKPDLKDTDGTDCDGICDSSELTIYIRENIKDSLQEDAIAHEIMEAINNHCELHLSHDVITVIGTAIAQVFNSMSFNNIAPEEYDITGRGF